MGILTSTLSSDLKNSHPRTFFPLLLEREEGKKKRDIDGREKHRLVAFPYTNGLGIKPVSQYMASLGIKPTTSWFWDNAPTK